jgi:hypothetical protein
MVAWLSGISQRPRWVLGAAGSTAGWTRFSISLPTGSRAALAAVPLTGLRGTRGMRTSSASSAWRSTGRSATIEFAREVAQLVAELDRRGGRQLVNEVYARNNVQAFDHGVAIGRDFNYFHAPDPNDLSGAPFWVKFVIALGTVVAVAGMFIFGYTLFTDMPDIGDPDFGEVPPAIPLAFGVFFAGFVLLGIGALGRAFSNRR